MLRAADVPTAVAAAYERGLPGEALLFSPACSSFDAYVNFQARARHFRSLLPSAADAAGARSTPPASGSALGP